MGRERRRSTSNACPSDRCERAGVAGTGGSGVGEAAGAGAGVGEALGSWAAAAAAARMNKDRRTADLKRA
jgi:hypothetical protein